MLAAVGLLVAAGLLLLLRALWAAEPALEPADAFARAPQPPTSVRAPQGEADAEPDAEPHAGRAEEGGEAEALRPDSRRAQGREGDARAALSAVVRGRAVDRGGQPLEGVLALGATGDTFWPLDAPGPYDAPAVATARTGPDGTFALRGLAPGPLRVALRVDGRAARDLDDLRLLAGASLDLGDLQLEPALPLEGRVVSRAGFELRFAAVLAFGDRLLGPWRAQGARMARRVAQVDDEGRFRIASLPAGRFRLLVVAEGHVPLHVEGFLDREATVQDELHVALEPDAPLTAIVPHPPLAARVAGLALGSWPAVDLEASEPGLALELLAAYRAAPVQQREVVLRGLPAKTLVELRALGAGQRFGDADAFAPPRLASAGRSVALERPPGATLRLEVRAAFADVPLERLRVELEGATTATPLDRDVWPGGVVGLADVRPFQLSQEPRGPNEREGGPFALTLDAPGRDLERIQDLKVVPLQELDLGRAWLQPLPELHVRVVAAAGGRPVADARLTLHAPPGVGRRLARARSGGDGRAVLTALAAPVGSLLVERAGFAPWRGPPPPISATREAPFEVRLEAGGRIEVRSTGVDGEVAPALVLRARHGAELDPFAPYEVSAAHQLREVDGAGLAVLADLLSGSHSVAVAPLFAIGEPAGGPAALAQWLPVAVGPGETAHLAQTPSGGAAVDVRVRAGGRPLADAVVRLGAGAEAFADPYADLRALRAWPTARTGEDGRCRFDGVAPGAYALRVEARGSSWFARRQVAVPQRGAAVDLDLLGGQVSGMVRDAAGEPLESGRARLLAWTGSWGAEPQIEPGARLDALEPEPLVLATTQVTSGAYAFAGVPEGVHLELRVDGTPGDLLAERSLAALAGAEAWLDTDLAAGPTVDLLADVQGSAPHGVALAVLGYNPVQPWGRGRFARLEDSFLRLEGLPAGDWNVRLALVDRRGVVQTLGPWLRAEPLAPGARYLRAQLHWPPRPPR